jgi:hypothetical protein
LLIVAETAAARQRARSHDQEHDWAPNGRDPQSGAGTLTQ